MMKRISKERGFSLHKQNRHNSTAQQTGPSEGYLRGSAALVLHSTVNYGPFNFIIMANGGGDAENSGFSRPHSGESGKETT